MSPWYGNSNAVHEFTGGGPSGKHVTVVPHINNTSSELIVFMLLLVEAIKLLVAETNWYYHQYSDTLEDWPSPFSDERI